MSKPIRSDWTIAKLISKYPQSIEVLVKYGFHCIGCALAQNETIEQGAKAHGFDIKQIHKLLKELNSLVDKKSEK